MRFREIQKLINEAPTDVLNASSQTDFRKWLTGEVGKLGIKTTQSSRNGFQIRFPLEGGEEDFVKFFNQFGVELRQTSASISGSFETYEVALTQSNDVLTAPVSMYWVNNITGGKDSDKFFGAKDLTPDDLGLAGGRFADADQIIDVMRPIIRERYPEHNPVLGGLITKTKDAQSNTVGISEIDLSKYSQSDLATISKNYGEILSAVWSMNMMDYEMVFFPAVSNAALIDFYGMIDGVEQPVSVKSGGGGKVTIQNILDALDDKIRAGKVNPEEERSYIVFDTIRKNNAKAGILELHKEFETEPMKALEKVMNMDAEEIDLGSLIEWLEDYDNEQLKKMLKPFLKSMNTTITDAIWDREDKVRFIISPLGEWLWKYLNDNTEVRQSMSNLAKNLYIIQINVDVKRKVMTYAANNFGDAEFEFGWAGYAAGNKLGFKMKL